MRILIDTNIIIPLEDIGVDFNEKLGVLSRLVSGKHELLIHPASHEDLARDNDAARRQGMLSRLSKYKALESAPQLSDEEEIRLFGAPAKANHKVDNRILYAVINDCVHWLITEDEGIHKKARRLSVEERVFSLDQVITVLGKLENEHVNLYPHIEDALCHTLDLNDSIFDSLRAGYSDFNLWFKEKCCQEGRHAWVCKEENIIGAICIYKRESGQPLTTDHKTFPGRGLKLCTFKVVKRGYKIGELLLKQAFTYSRDNQIDYIYATIDPSDHDLLHQLFADFGFYHYGTDTAGRDDVYIKELPRSPPVTADKPLDYAVKYFPVFKLENNSAFLVPIQPEYHEILFPELVIQSQLFDEPTNSAGNAIKQAYLCKAPNKSIKPGDLLFFYRTRDQKSLTTYGIVDQFFIESDIDKIFQWVSKRTVYSYQDIQSMVNGNAEIKVILFRLLGHVRNPITFDQLKKMQIVTGPIQSIISINKANAIKIIEEASINDCLISN